MQSLTWKSGIINAVLSVTNVAVETVEACHVAPQKGRGKIDIWLVLQHRRCNPLNHACQST